MCSCCTRLCTYLSLEKTNPCSSSPSSSKSAPSPSDPPTVKQMHSVSISTTVCSTGLGATNALRQIWCLWSVRVHVFFFFFCFFFFWALSILSFIPPYFLLNCKNHNLTDPAPPSTILFPSHKCMIHTYKHTIQRHPSALNIIHHVANTDASWLVQKKETEEKNFKGTKKIKSPFT